MVTEAIEDQIEVRRCAKLLDWLIAMKGHVVSKLAQKPRTIKELGRWKAKLYGMRSMTTLCCFVGP